MVVAVVVVRSFFIAVFLRVAWLWQSPAGWCELETEERREGAGEARGERRQREGRRVRPVGEAMSSIGSSNIGFQLLKKSGWKEGTGLGAQEQGRLEPVETRVKNNKRGLGSKEPKPKAEDDVETAPSKRPKNPPSTKKAKLAAKRIRKMQEEEKRAQEKEFEIAFFREFWPDNV